MMTAPHTTEIYTTPEGTVMVKPVGRLPGGSQCYVGHHSGTVSEGTHSSDETILIQFNESYLV